MRKALALIALFLVAGAAQAAQTKANAKFNTKQIIVPFDNVGVSYSQVIPVENLSADGDIAARAEWQVPRTAKVKTVKILSRGSPAGIDDSNTMVVTVANATTVQTVATYTFNTTNTFPAASAAQTLTLTAAQSVITAADVITIAVTNGSTADPPLFDIIIEYVQASQAATYSFLFPSDCKVHKVSLMSKGTAAGIDNSNTFVVTVTNATDSTTIGTVTFNATTTFPAAGAIQALTLTDQYPEASDAVTVTFTAGNTAYPPAFALLIDYSSEGLWAPAR